MTSTLKEKPEECLETRQPKRYKWDIVWINVILIGILHLAAVYGGLTKFNGKWQSYLFWKILSIISTLGVTGGGHRLWAHSSYQANNFFQILLMCMMSMTYQNSIYVWARDHRLHHKYQETDGDPHNAQRGFFFSHVGWLMVRKHPDVISKGKTIDLSDLRANPVVMFQHRYYYFLLLLFAVILPTSIPMYFWNETFKYSFFTVTIYRYIVTVNITWCINSVAHLYGNKPYDKNIAPTENLILRYVGFGEGFHNYHHTFPWDYKAAELGCDTRNLTTMMIDGFAWLGCVTNRRYVSPKMIKSRMMRTGDGTTNDLDGDEVLVKYLDVPKKEFRNFRNFIIFVVYIIFM